MKIMFEDDEILEKKYIDEMVCAAEAALEAEGLNHETAEISLSLADMESIRELNREYRGIDRPTDVLSFPQFEAEELMYYSENPDEAPDELMLGDVVICIEKAEEQAAEFGHGFERELLYLFTHSVLHLLGYDHIEEDDKTVMREREEEILGKIGINR